jgi:uncharacterized membrane protein
MTARRESGLADGFVMPRRPPVAGAPHVRFERSDPLMSRDVHALAQQLLHKSYEALTRREQEVIQRIARRVHISRNVRAEHEERLTFGQRLADRVAAFGGSWPFISIFFAVLVAWVLVNSVVLARRHESFDPYPYILLNLMLSMLAAVQAPVIMMSQNRQAAKDRADAAHDYEVNLKAELEIMSLHDKFDSLRDRQWGELLTLQQEQIRLLTQIIEGTRGPSC